MKKLICTGKFEGEMVVVYNDDHQLVLFDLQNTNMTAEMVFYFTQRVPVLGDVKHFRSIFSTLTVVDEDCKVSFEDFWNRYDKKVNAKRAEMEWDRLNIGDQVKAHSSLNSYLRVVKPKGWREKADPTTYLRNRMWETDWSKQKN